MIGLIINFLFAFTFSIFIIFIIRTIYYFIKFKLNKKNKNKKFSIKNVIKDTILESFIIKYQNIKLKLKYK